MLWTEEEKQKLMQFVENNGSPGRISWVGCAEFLRSKNPRQCYDYYSLHQAQRDDEKPQRHAWTQEENEKIQKFRENEMTWKQFQQ